MSKILGPIHEKEARAYAEARLEKCERHSVIHVLASTVLEFVESHEALRAELAEWEKKYEDASQHVQNLDLQPIRTTLQLTEENTDLASRLEKVKAIWEKLRPEIGKHGSGPHDSDIITARFAEHQAKFRKILSTGTRVRFPKWTASSTHELHAESNRCPGSHHGGGIELRFRSTHLPVATPRTETCLGG